VNPEDIAIVDRKAARAWPAEDELARGGWLLRANRGITGRANSCWALAYEGAEPLEARIDAVEAFYAARRLPPRFYISPAAKPSPETLVAALERRGYKPSVPTQVMFAPIATALARARVRRDVTLAETAEEAWREVMLAGTPTADEALGRFAIVERAPPPGRYATAWKEGRPVAIGRAGLDGDQCGIVAMRTATDARRQGYARAVLGTLIAWAATAGATRLYLQVETGNAEAIALYRDNGFATGYEYRYWAKGGDGTKHD
jgi:GNAT superfamily N-acetyltransferase